MQRPLVNFSLKLTVLAGAIVLSGCSVLEGDKVDYKSSSKAPPLAVPPDLTQLSKDTRYSVVNGGVSAVSSAKTTPQSSADSVALNAVGDIRVERLGNQRWLVVNRSAVNLWGPLKSFWQDSGFKLSMDQADVGIKIRLRANPEDLIGAYTFLASPAAAYITGQCLYVDGGLSAW